MFRFTNEPTARNNYAAQSHHPAHIPVRGERVVERQLVVGRAEPTLGSGCRSHTPWDCSARGSARRVSGGTASASKSNSPIIVISDQFALREPLLDVVSRGATVWWAFFASQLDARCHTLLRKQEAEHDGSKGRLLAIDLDDHHDELSGVPKAAPSSNPRGSGPFACIAP